MYDLMIIFKAGKTAKLTVSNYGVVNNDNGNLLYFIIDTQRSFVPVDAVLYFGEPIDFNFS